MVRGEFERGEDHVLHIVTLTSVVPDHVAGLEVLGEKHKVLGVAVALLFQLTALGCLVQLRLQIGPRIEGGVARLLPVRLQAETCEHLLEVLDVGLALLALGVSIRIQAEDQAGRLLQRGPHLVQHGHGEEAVGVSVEGSQSDLGHLTAHHQQVSRLPALCWDLHLFGFAEDAPPQQHDGVLRALAAVTPRHHQVEVLVFLAQKRQELAARLLQEEHVGILVGLPQDAVDKRILSAVEGLADLTAEGFPSARLVEHQTHEDGIENALHHQLQRDAGHFFLLADGGILGHADFLQEAVDFL
mmetsp:Transcript_125184/g.297050  ORF Transcript_125184/g.297050 Transcript_125184/m.297050 type:complete len:300 (-) Transcript_125184:618-1517(-)